ncbi:MAG: putative transcriptional regulator, marr family protein [Osedax symbiont Rs2]|nr:MAG: putative transcriptional regulator, marr family protein [Osedax symbiont Rs2]
MSTNTAKILTLERFLPYQLSVSSNKISGFFADIYRDKFALSITQWRIMAILGEYPDSSADEVSNKTQIEKSILSRAISKLLHRHLIQRVFCESDKRRSMLSLTDTGMDVYNEVVPLSYQYEQQLFECFDLQEKEQFNSLLEKLYKHTENLQTNI